jgi:hypothetical protein
MENVVRNSFYILFVCFFMFINITSARDFKVGVDDSRFYPFFETEKGVFQPSFTNDLFFEFGKEKGHTFTFVPLPEDRILSELFLGNIDFEFPDNQEIRNFQKESRIINYSVPVVLFVDGLMAFGNRTQFPIEMFKKVGILENAKPFPLYDYLKTGQMTLIASPSAEYLIRETLDGRLDAVYMNKEFAEQIQTKLGSPGRLVFQNQLPHIISKISVGTQKHADIIAELNEFVTSRPDVIRKIKDKHQIE